MSPKLIGILFGLILAVFLSTSAVLIWSKLGPASPPTPPTPTPSATSPASSAPVFTIPEFSLITADGQPFTRESLKGKVWIADFFFTHCPFVCPMLTETMADIARSLSDQPNIGFASFSIDPAHDTPARLKEYMKLHEATAASGGKWLFLTDPAGSDAAVRRIVTQGLQFALEPDPTKPIQLPDGTTMSNIIHPSWYILIDKETNVLGIYKSGVPEDVERLKADARKAGAKG